MTLEEIVILKCSVCGSIKLDDTWYSKPIIEYITINNPHKYTDTICSKHCARMGYGMSIDDVDDVFNYD